MESKYEKVHKILKHIDEITMDELENCYKDDSNLIKKLVIDNEYLNEARAKTKVAVECLNNDYLYKEHKNKNISDHLNRLQEYSEEMDVSSRKLAGLLDEFNDVYIQNSKKYSEELLNLVTALKEGNVNGDELIRSSIVLGKNIEKFINEEMEQQVENFKWFISKQEDYFCNNVDHEYRQIQNLDSDLLSTLRYNFPWTALQFDDVFRRPAYNHKI